MHFDVIIIGAGSMGMAAGYFLAKSGKSTLLLDAHTPLISVEVTMVKQE